MLFAKLRARDHRRHLHGLADIHNVGNQIGKAHLNQAHHRRAGGGDQRPGQVGLAQLLGDGAADNIRPARHLKHIVEADLFQRRQHRLHALQVAELPVQRGRGQGDGITEGLDGIKFIGHGHLGVIIADADALAAVNAALGDDMRTAVAHADGLGRAVHQAVGAALAAAFIQLHGMITLGSIHDV